MALFSSEDDESENRTNPLWKVLQKSFVSYKKLQFSKRMYAMKNALFSRRIHDETSRGVRNTVVMILGERMNAFDRLIARVDAFFFASYVSEFPPIESKKMFLFTTTSTTTNNKETTTMKMKSIDFVANQVGGYTTDCGWGCTLRSAQMLFGEALMRSARARRFRRRSLRRSEEDVSEEDSEGEEFKRKKEIVDMFSDDNDDDENEDKKEKKKKKTKNVFGLRRVYEGDEDENALCPGQWMAPSEICKRYGKMMNGLDSSSASSSSKTVRNVRCLILGDGCGGGVPEFYPERV